MDLLSVTTLGALYGAIQAIAQVVCLVVPKHTLAFKIAKFVIAGPARPASSSTITGDAG